MTNEYDAARCCICGRPASRVVTTRGLAMTGQTLYCDPHAAELLSRAGWFSSEAVAQIKAEARAEALRDAAEECERVERVAQTPVDQAALGELGWFQRHALRNVDGFQRHRTVVAAWLRDRANLEHRRRAEREAHETPTADLARNRAEDTEPEGDADE